MLIKKILCIIMSILIIFSLTSCGEKKTNSELFFENQNNFFEKDLYSYNINYDDVNLYGKIDKTAKIMTINLAQNNQPPMSAVVNGNEAYISLQSISEFIKNTYSNDEQMALIAETLDAQYTEYKYLRLKISESDIWNNFASLSTTIPEGDMQGLYLLVTNTINNINEYITANIDNPTLITIDKNGLDIISGNVMTQVISSKEKYEPFLKSMSESMSMLSGEYETFDIEESIKNIQAFISEYVPDSLSIEITEDSYKIYTENISIVIKEGESFTLPDDLESSYDIDSALTEPMTINVDMEINDGEAIDTEVEYVDDNTFVKEAEDDSIYGLISLTPENFKDIITKSLSDIGFEEISSTTNSIDMSHIGIYDYFVSFNNNAIILRMETNKTDAINEFSNEFVASSIPILGLDFDKYTVNSDLQEAYNEAINIFNNTKQKIYKKTGTINDTKVEYSISNIDDLITISIESSRRLPEMTTES